MSIRVNNEPPIDEPLDLPPLRIHQLLIWTAVLGGMLALLDWSKLFDPSESLGAAVVVIVGQVFSSAALTGVLFGCVWWWRGLGFPREPGHGLLILTAIGTVVYLLQLVLMTLFVDFSDGAAAYYGLQQGASRWVFGLVRWSGPIVGVFGAILSVAFAVWLVHAGRWRTVFLFIAALALVGAAVHAFVSLLIQIAHSRNIDALDIVFWTNLSTDAIPKAVLLLLLVLCVMEDRRLALARHWSHWCGVGVYFMVSAFEVMRYIVWYLSGNG